MVQTKLLDFIKKGKYTKQLDRKLSSYIPDFFKENDEIGLRAMKFACLYKKIHEDLIKNKKMDYEELIKNKTYYDIIELIEKIKNEKSKIMNEAQSMYFENLLDEDNEEFTKFKEKTKETTKEFVKKHVELECLASINWIESNYNSIFYTFLHTDIDKFIEQNTNDILNDYKIILNKTKNLISNEYLVKVKNAYESFKNKIKNINTHNIKTPFDQIPMELRVKEQNALLEFIKEESIKVSKFAEEIIIKMCDENLFDELFNFINQYYFYF